MHYQQPSNQLHRPIPGRLLAIFALGLCLAIIAGGVILSPLHGARAVSAPTNWVQAGFNRQRTGYNPFETTLSPLNVSGLTNAWTYYTGDGGVNDPVENNGLLYFDDGYGTIYALNASTGTSVWSSAGRGAGAASPAIVNSILYSGSAGGTLYALNVANGVLVWARTIGTGFASSPLTANGVIYIGSLDHHLYALSTTSGKTLWSFLTGSAITSNAATDTGDVYIDSGGTLYALNSKTGKMLWRYAVQGSPVIANGLVYIGTSQLVALNEKTGKLVWTYVVGSGAGVGTVAAANGDVFFSDNYGVFHTVNALNGHSIWSYDLTVWEEYVSTTPVVANGAVYVGGYEYDPGGVLELAFNEGTGALLWWNQDNGCIASTSPVVVNGMVFFGREDCSAMLGYRL